MRLERRYWKIDSLNDNIDEVDGPGKARQKAYNPRIKLGREA